MSSLNRKQKFQSYQEYFLINSDLIRNQTPKANNKKNKHKRKISQVSTQSFHSKQKSVYKIDKCFSTVKKNLFSESIASTDHSKLPYEMEQKAKKQQVQRISKNLNKKPVTTKQKLKIKTQRKINVKQSETLTSRYLKIPQKSISTSSTFILKQKCQSNPVKIKQKNLHKNQKIGGLLKIRQKQMDAIVNKCSKIMTQYADKLNQFKRQNQSLKRENQTLKKCTPYQSFVIQQKTTY